MYVVIQCKNPGSVQGIWAQIIPVASWSVYSIWLAWCFSSFQPLFFFKFSSYNCWQRCGTVLLSLEKFPVSHTLELIFKVGIWWKLHIWPLLKCSYIVHSGFCKPQLRYIWRVILETKDLINVVGVWWRPKVPQTLLELWVCPAVLHL